MKRKIRKIASLPKFPSRDAWAKAWQSHWCKAGVVTLTGGGDMSD
jgi:hypothetical protein